STGRESACGRKNGRVACRIVCNGSLYGSPATRHLQRKRSCRRDRGSVHRGVKSCGDFLIDGDICASTGRSREGNLRSQCGGKRPHVIGGQTYASGILCAGRNRGRK